MSIDPRDHVAVSPDLTATSTNLVFMDERSALPLSFHEIRRVRQPDYEEEV